MYRRWRRGLKSPDKFVRMPSEWHWQWRHGLASPPRDRDKMAESVAITISRFEERVANLKERWYFTKEELKNFPSRVHGVDSAKELSYRQQAASLIKDVGHRIGVYELNITHITPITPLKSLVANQLDTLPTWAVLWLYCVCIVEKCSNWLYSSRLFYSVHRGQLCIATAVVYMHRFFIVHSFKAFPRFVSYFLIWRWSVVASVYVRRVVMYEG